MTFLTLLYLYIAFRLKHLTCDFLLQSDWMALNKGELGQNAYKALFSHALIHAIGTLIITLIFAPSLWWLCLIDLVVHSVIDRLKGTVVRKRQWQVSDTKFWWSLGIDQELHNFTHLAYIVVIFVYTGGILL